MTRHQVIVTRPRDLGRRGWLVSDDGVMAEVFLFHYPLGFSWFVAWIPSTHLAPYSGPLLPEEATIVAREERGWRKLATDEQGEGS